MIPAILIMIAGAVCTLILIAPIAATHKKTCYALIIIIPVLLLSSYIAIFSPDFLLQRSDIEQLEIVKVRKTLDSDKNNPDIAVKLAGLYISTEKFDDAITLLENFEQDDENIRLQLATAYFAKGLLHAENGQKAQALKALRKAHNVAPEDAGFLGDIVIFIDKVEETL